VPPKPSAQSPEAATKCKQQCGLTDSLTCCLCRQLHGVIGMPTAHGSHSLIRPPSTFPRVQHLRTKASPYQCAQRSGFAFVSACVGGPGVYGMQERMRKHLHSPNWLCTLPQDTGTHQPLCLFLGTAGHTLVQDLLAATLPSTPASCALVASNSLVSLQCILALWRLAALTLRILTKTGYSSSRSRNCLCLGSPRADLPF